MTDWFEARRIAWAAGVSLPAVEVDLGAALGRVLAEPLTALVELPPFDTAAMDGWAVCGAGPWRVVGQVLAGHPVELQLSGGEAVEIATGALVPSGADGVLPVEQGRCEDGRVFGAVPAGRHIRRAGEECAAGTVLLAAGTVLTPAALGLAAAVGHDRLTVHARPRVACFVTGDELLLTGRPGNGRVRDAVGPLLPGAVAAAGGELITVRHLSDEPAVLRDALAGAEADVVVTTGASSVGRADFLPAALHDLGATLLVDGVDVRPGHPQVLARLDDGRLVVGLPGNPLAALSGIVTLLVPLLAGLAGRPLPALGQLRLAEEAPAVASGVRLLPVSLDGGVARLTGHGGSAMLRGAALADGFAVLPAGGEQPAGQRVEVVPLPR